MYSHSRGILYTAPPGPNDETDSEADANAEASTGTGDDATAPPETADGLAADD